MDSKPLVSVICTAYNHEPYIRDTIEGFLMQKTTFPYEVIIHDDASTDKTASIIREYKNKHPDIVKPIFQAENQYSKGIKINSTFCLPKAEGKYVALCEGDDYWTDENKLQIQVEYMEEHPECTLCCHAHRRVHYSSKNTIKTKKFMNSDGDIEIDCIITTEKFPQLVTFLLKKEIMLNRPEIFLNNPVGDVPLVTYCAIKGKVHYINKVMASYRVLVPGSWTHRNSLNDLNSKAIFRYKMISFYERLDEYTEYRYSDKIAESISLYHFKNDIDKKEYLNARKRLYFKNAPVKKKILIILRLIYPNKVPLFAWLKPKIQKYLP